MQILFLYEHSHISPVAQTIKDHIYSFKRYSEHNYVYMDPKFGLPASLDCDAFDAILLHYSVYTPLNLFLHAPEINKIRSSSAHKILFIQDEYRQVRKAIDFMNYLKIDTLYTLFDPSAAEKIYPLSEVSLSHRKTCLPGYMEHELASKLRRDLPNQLERRIDVGYRGRPLPFWLGEFAQRKSQIGEFFSEIARKENLDIDIKTAEAYRIYGKKWFDFLKSCKATLGVESGSGIIDYDGHIQEECEEYIKEHVEASFEEVECQVLNRHPQNAVYRTISPRVFEAAMTKTCQILTEGFYSGVIEADKHYIPIKSDFSNYREVLNKFRDVQFRAQITENAYNDLCLSDRWTYATFVAEFDEHLNTVVSPKAEQIVRKNNTLFEYRHRATLLPKEILQKIRQWICPRIPKKTKRTMRILLDRVNWRSLIKLVPIILGRKK